MKSILLNIHFFVREKNIKIIFPQSKDKKIPDKKTKKYTHQKRRRKDDTKTRYPQMIFYGNKVTVVILGILTLLNNLVLGVGLKFRSKELELEADIW